MQKTTTAMLMGKRIIFLLVFFSVAVFFSCKQKEEKKAETNLRNNTEDCNWYWPAVPGKDRFLELDQNRAIIKGQVAMLILDGSKYYLKVQRSETSQPILIELDPNLPPTGHEPACSTGLQEVAYYPYLRNHYSTVRLIKYGVDCAASSSLYEVIFTNKITAEVREAFLTVKLKGSANQTEDPIELKFKVPPEVG